MFVIISGCSKGKAEAYRVKNPFLKDEMYHLRQEMQTRNLTEADTTKITLLSKDPVERYYAKEFAWLVKNDEYEHLNHPLTFLDWYVRTGNETFCAPHELGHMAAYIEKDDIPYAQETFAVVKQKMRMWDEKQESNSQKYPQFYLIVGELKAMMSQAISLLDNKNYSNDTTDLLKQIDLKSVC